MSVAVINGHVRRKHDGRVLFIGHVRVGHHRVGGLVFRHPQLSTSRRLGQLPVVSEQVVKVAAAFAERRKGENGAGGQTEGKQKNKNKDKKR